MTLYRVPAQKLLDAFKRRPFGDQLAVGGLAYVAEPLKLGMLGGNRFTIVLRDVKRAPCAPDGQGAADAASRGGAAGSDGATHSDEVSQPTLTLAPTLSPTPTPTPAPTPTPHPNPHQVSQEELGAALAALADRGFVNYFGLQRFGANAAAPTHTVGLSLTLTQILNLNLNLTLALALSLTLTKPYP